jgi:hypothetical protein
MAGAKFWILKNLLTKLSNGFQKNNLCLIDRVEKAVYLHTVPAGTVPGTCFRPAQLVHACMQMRILKSWVSLRSVSSSSVYVLPDQHISG